MKAMKSFVSFSSTLLEGMTWFLLLALFVNTLRPGLLAGWFPYGQVVLGLLLLIGVVVLNLAPATEKPWPRPWLVTLTLIAILWAIPGLSLFVRVFSALAVIISVGALIKNKSYD